MTTSADLIDAILDTLADLDAALGDERGSTDRLITELDQKFRTLRIQIGDHAHTMADDIIIQKDPAWLHVGWTTTQSKSDPTIGASWIRSTGKVRLPKEIKADQLPKLLEVLAALYAAMNERNNEINALMEEMK